MKNYFEPIHIKKYLIYDIFFNYLNQLIIICPRIKNFNIIYKNKKFNFFHCPHKHTTIFVCNNVKREEEIELSINGELFKIRTNNYPNFNGELIFSTMVKNEDNYIKQWINYHHKNGVKRFIIYDNAEGDDGGKSYYSKEKTSNLKELLKDYLENDIVVLIKWIYPKRTSPPISINGQTTQQNHSIYTFRNSKFIGLFDIDEYVNIQKKINLNCFLKTYINSKKININKISALRLLNKFFYNPHNKDVSGNNFLKINNCDIITKKGQEKCIVIPKNVNTFSIHRVTSGKKMIQIEPKKAFFNHYFFLNKNNRGNKKIKYIDNSILLHLE